MLNTRQRCAFENILLENEFLETEIKVVKLKEQLYLLKKYLKYQTGNGENSSGNAELAQLLSQQNANLLEKNASINWIIEKTYYEPEYRE